MTQVIRFEGLSIPVSDVARSVAFYQTLGFSVEQSGPAFALLRLGEGTIGLTRARLDDYPATARQGVHIELSVDDLDALYDELRGRGLSIDEPPHEEPWERAMALRDPDGYQVEFAQGRRGHNQPR